MSHKAKTHSSVHKRKSMKRNLGILSRAIGSSNAKKAQATAKLLSNIKLIKSKLAYDRKVKANIKAARTVAQKRG